VRHYYDTHHRDDNRSFATCPGERISIACYTVAALSKRHANDCFFIGLADEIRRHDSMHVAKSTNF
jgi:hypothetical protein